MHALLSLHHWLCLSGVSLTTQLTDEEKTHACFQVTLAVMSCQWAATAPPTSWVNLKDAGEEKSSQWTEL